MTLRRRIIRLETRTPDQLRARIAAMTDAEIEERIAELRGQLEGMARPWESGSTVWKVKHHCR